MLGFVLLSLYDICHLPPVQIRFFKVCCWRVDFYCIPQTVVLGFFPLPTFLAVIQQVSIMSHILLLLQSSKTDIFVRHWRGKIASRPSRFNMIEWLSRNICRYAQLLCISISAQGSWQIIAISMLLHYPPLLCAFMIRDLFINEPINRACHLDGHYPGALSLNHCPLGDLVAILKMQFSILFHGSMSTDLFMGMPSGECKGTLLMITKAPSHYLIQCWFRSISLYDIIRPH